jgi:hypothetical protein
MSDRYTINLTEEGSNKINTIKTVRGILNLGLREAKKLVESAPIVLKAEANADEVSQFQDAFRGTALLEVLRNEHDYRVEPTVWPVLTVTEPKNNTWVDLRDLKVGEIVSTTDPSATSLADLRLITDSGAYNFFGKLAAPIGSGTFYKRLFYKRLPKGTNLNIQL